MTGRLVNTLTRHESPSTRAMLGLVFATWGWLLQAGSLLGQDSKTDDVLQDLVRSVELGAPDPREDNGQGVIHGSDFEKAREFWAFRPLDRAAAPSVKNQGWPANWVDRFVLAKLEAHGLSPAAPATQQELIRRVYYDVTGLPPTPEEVDAFVADKSADAYEALVDRLLDSTHYGERAAQHWLDVVRFAESEGFEYDRHLPDAWRYRDYVIHAFNSDKPFDEFLVEQVAGDELDADNEEYLTAAVFHRLGAVRRNAGNQDIAASRNEVLTERTDILGAAFLGMTVGCARCHDHKFDPITQKDYYRLQAFLAATAENDVVLLPEGEAEEFERKRRQVNQQIGGIQRQLSGERLNDEERAELEQQLADLRAQIPPDPPQVPSIKNDFESRTEIHVLRRGVWEKKGEPVGPRGMSVMTPESFAELPADMDRPRTKLARWMIGPARPLVARVIVNRLWQNVFGKGIVTSANNFGTNGMLPSHPQLLDALSLEFIQGGWRPKSLTRLLLLSQTYRQSSHPADATRAATLDPSNRLLWKYSRRRLSAEEIRDSMLAIAGRLNLKAGGPSVMVPIDQGLVDLLYKPDQWEITPDISAHDRRSIYLISKRNLRLPFMEVFDQPIAQISCPRRDATTHAPQALELLNGDLSNRLAGNLAERLQSECGDDTDVQVKRAYRLAIGRSPTDQERTIATGFLRENTLQEFSLAVINLHEFLYVD